MRNGFTMRLTLMAREARPGLALSVLEINCEAAALREGWEAGLLGLCGGRADCV